jgi:hypothetical protein
MEYILFGAGATAVANDDVGGSLLTAGFMGHCWSSSAKFGLFASRQKVEHAALVIGRAHHDSGPLAVRPGPSDVYALSRD